MRRLFHILAAPFRWLRAHSGLVAILVVLAAGGYVAFTQLDEEEEPAPAPAAPPVVVREQAPKPDETEPADLGFPAFATRNTTRVSGADPIADAAAVALATFPSTGGLRGPAAVSLVDAKDWRAGIAAASLAAEPVRAPVLLTESGEVPALTQSAVEALGPRGSQVTGKSQAFLIGDAADPGGLKARKVAGKDPAALAAGLERLRAELSGQKPEHLLIAPAQASELAMPAAGWAARSGDPVLFANRQAVPAPTLEAIKRNPGAAVYVLGPEAGISAKAFGQIKKAAPDAKRVAAAEDAVTGAIEFARLSDGTFGWNINDPGHGFVVANADRPADAGAAAMLSASGTWGPLLLTDDAERLPATLRGYLLDLKPGYQDDPTRALYNHIWVIGDTEAVSVEQQAQLDELAELVQITSGSGGGVLGPPPGTPEDEAPNRGDR